jgi:seryl-tRNA synthetase
MTEKYQEKSKSIIDQHSKRIKNWQENQKWQYKTDSDAIRYNINELKTRKNASKYFNEKIDIQKKIDNLEKKLKKRDENFHSSMLNIEKQAEKDIKIFNAQYMIDLVVVINLIVKY